MKPWKAAAIISLLWVGIYLPGIGSLDLKGEEPRRALPAIHMLESGDWLVPRVGSTPYLKKPPLLNWLIALSFRAGGVHEWTARLPSALAVLALGLVLTLQGARWLGSSGALLAGIFWLTNIALMETGRSAELEAVYCSLTGMAFVFWMTLWWQRAGSWVQWLLPAVFLALGMLEKGPLHLVYFYVIVIGTLCRAGEGRKLREPAHFVAVALILGSYLAWAIPCAHAVTGQVPVSISAFWLKQLSSHSVSAGMHWRDWLQNIPRGLAAFLPWTAFFPLLWVRDLGSRLEFTRREDALFNGAGQGGAWIFVLVSLLPAASPRYVYPLLVIPCLLLARVLTLPPNDDAEIDRAAHVWHYTNLAALAIICLGALFVPVAMPGLLGLGLAAIVFVSAMAIGANRWLSGYQSCLHLGITSGLIMTLITGIYAAAVIPRLKAAKPLSASHVATRIRHELPPGGSLWISENTYSSLWYYLEPGAKYFSSTQSLPMEAKNFLLSDDDLKAFPRERLSPDPSFHFVTWKGAAGDPSLCLVMLRP